MLLELQISDFAIIDRLHLRFEAGFNVLSGETGAGKSIIIDALGTLRGEKTDIGMVRAGASRARIEGVFGLPQHVDVVALLREYGLFDESEDQIILSREISAESGRSVARINGRAVGSSVLREIGGRLIDIHGQHEGLTLFNVRTHQEMLDRFGEITGMRDELAAGVTELRQVREELAEIRRSEARRQERIEELRFLIEDVQAAGLSVGEEEGLMRERSVLQNVARITNLAGEAYAELYGGREGERMPARPVVEAMALISANLSELAQLDQSVAGLADQANELQFQLEDLAAGLRAYRLGLDLDPGRLDQIEDRLTVLRDIQRKHGGDIAAILARAASADAEIERLSNSSEHISALEAQEVRLLQDLALQAGELSRRRQTTGAALAQQIETAMTDLAMPRVRFAVRLSHSDDPDGLPMEGAGPWSLDGAPRRLTFDRLGVDRVEFMIAPNPGEPLKPLARIASGGESSRLLLALKSILSQVDDVPTLVFDEIDVGVGGRAGQVVGQKLWALTAAHQVLCITHLAQVAAFGDRHFHISKQIDGERTRTNVRPLEPHEQIDELAAMLDGVPISDHSRANARQIVDRAGSWKQSSTPSRSASPLESVS
jgi:DNA repair protein RecN (Recombination protein N)